MLRPAVRVAWCLTVAFLAALTAHLVTSDSAHAATITVTTAADTIDADGGGCVGLDIASLPGIDGVVSLREAICAANGTAGADSIGFNISGAGVKTITLGSVLPALTQTVTIDGFTQPGASPNTTPFGQADDAVILIEIHANGLVSALRTQSTNITIRGLSIGGVNNGPAGVVVESGDAIISGNRIGLRADGDTVRANYFTGVRVLAGARATIGGTAAADRNIISGNPISGIQFFTGAANGSAVLNNYIGTNAAGTAARGNGQHGVETGLTDVQVGAPGAGNLISGNGEAGILRYGNAVVQANRIGTNAAGTAAIPNMWGIQERGINNAGEVGLTGTNADGVNDAAEGNLISGNITAGINFITVNVGAATGNVFNIAGNLIGADITGTSAVPNGVGILLTGSTKLGAVTIGGTIPAARNVISGNTGDGVAWNNSIINAGVIRFIGNFVGTNAAGAGPLPNGGSGIRVANGDHQLKIGGTGAGEGNVIRHNAGAGVVVTGGDPLEIRGNIIDQNGGLGIDLGAGGVTPNDVNDVDGGANGLQNFPVLTSVLVTGGTTQANGTLNSTVNTTFDVDLFASPSCDASGNGEGRRYLGTTSVTTVGNNATISANVTGVAVGDYITATATSPTFQTSEFSACVTAAIGGNGVTVSKTAVAVAEGGAGDTFTVALTSIPASTVTVTITFDHAQLTVSPSTLTFQPDASALTGQTVTVNAVDDTVGDEAPSSAITFTTASATAAFNGLSVAPVTANISDNDASASSSNAVSPNNSDEPTKRGDRDSKGDKESEESKQQRERTNRSGQDDYRNEGNVVEVHADAVPPFVIVANRDGLVKIVLYGEAAKAAGSIKVGDYLEADGEKINELLFEATDISISRPR